VTAVIDAHVHYWQVSRGDYAWMTPDLAWSLVAWIICKLISAVSYARSTAWGQNGLDHFELGDFSRVVASSYHLRRAYAEGILLKSLDSLSRLNC